MKLVLAEKPSVAQSIAKVLGATKREDGYLEGNGYVVSWCVGHLVELSQPEAYDEKYNKWAYADLPIFPDQWKYQVSASTKKQFGILKKLMARKDVESLVCATDAGREGELIFRLVYQQAGCRKPFERLWISSMEDSAIREGFEQLKPSTEYDALYEAALCRERADWLVGINATRLFSTLYGQTLNVGRVMTPTLAMVVMREAAISAFRPEPFYTVELAFQDFTASGERMKQKVLADDVARKCVGSVLNVTKAENKEKSEKPPALYDLTSLQRDANRVLGFTAQQTLDYTQSLYEKKLVTYPRTDSRYLTSDMKDMLPELIKSLFNIFPVEDVKNVPVHAAQVINDKKVSDHHAIIPTKEAIKCSLDDLPKGEQAILRLIATRLFCAVGEPFRYNESVIELSDGNYIFSAKGKTTVQSGWKIFSGKPADKDKEGEKQLPSLTVGEGLSVYSTEVKEGKTSPPKHFTEDTLLQSMETAGADEMPEDAERKGLGTPATRAATIEKLVRIGFLERKGDKKTKHLISTHKGTALVTVMPEQIQSPSMTADWEEKLLMIERGEYDSNAFLKEIQDMISALVQTYEKVKGSDVLMAKEVQTVGVCPVCGSSVTERQKGFFCSKRECHFALWKNSRYFESIGKSLTSAVAQKLLSNGEVMLKITGDGRKLGLDQRLINPLLPDDPESKLNACVQNVLRIWEEGKADRLTQLLFCDLSTPKNDGTFNVYDDIKAKLIAAGVPEKEIAFIHDADSEAKKKELFAKVRTGQVRVLMGSTQKMGAGTNCQDRLVALHHLDVGWRPSDMTQRNGRIIRQGNQNKEVQIYQYVTEGTFDAYLYQTLENKQKFISQIMTSKSPVRSCDDVDEQALSYAEIKALCAGNPLIKEKMDLDIDVARLKVLKADHQSQQYRMEDKLLKYFPAEIERQTGYIRGFEADIQTVTTHPQIVEGFCGMEILGKHYMEKEDAGEMILAACKEMKATEPIPLGSYRGFQMELSFDSFRHDFDITLKGAVSHRVSLGTDARGNIIRLDNALSSIPEKLEKAHEQLTNLQNQQEATRAELGKPFPQEAELAEKSARLAELDAALNMEDSMPEREEAEQADKPSVLADLKAKSEHIPPYRASGGREEVL